MARNEIFLRKQRGPHHGAADCARGDRLGRLTCGRQASQRDHGLADIQTERNAGIPAPFRDREKAGVGLHNESQIFQLPLHSIEIASGFEARNGVPSMLGAHAIPASGQETTEHLSGLPGIYARLMQLIVKVLQFACRELFDFCVCGHLILSHLFYGGPRHDLQHYPRPVRVTATKPNNF
jgi:hypothetical protein